MSDMKLNKNLNGVSDAVNAPKKAGALSSVSPKTNDDLELINELAADANPRQIKQWIARLEVLYEEKRTAIRTDLKSQLDDLLHTNDYTIEELYTARPIPSTSELAEQAKKRKTETQSKRDLTINSICGV